MEEIIDVWQGVWRCTHAKLAPLTPHPLARDRHNEPASRQRRECFGAGNLSAPISPLLLKCVEGATTLFLHFGISGLGGKLAAGCLRSRPTWIIFCFCCWVADGKNGEGGWGWVAAVMVRYSRAISILRRTVRATKAATWSHPSVLFSIIGTKLSGVRRG